MSDKTWMSPEELAKCSRAYDVDSEDFCSPIPTQNVSNGEYLPKPQSEKQKQRGDRFHGATISGRSRPAEVNPPSAAGRGGPDALSISPPPP